MVFNLTRPYTKSIPIALHIRIIDIPPLKFVWANHREPWQLRESRHRKHDGFGQVRDARGWEVRYRLDELEEVLQCEAHGTWEGESARGLCEMHQIHERLSHVDNLRAKGMLDIRRAKAECEAYVDGTHCGLSAVHLPPHRPV